MRYQRYEQPAAKAGPVRLQHRRVHRAAVQFKQPQTPWACDQHAKVDAANHATSRRGFAFTRGSMPERMPGRSRPKTRFLSSIRELFSRGNPR
jgi:hypothetical protein